MVDIYNANSKYNVEKSIKSGLNSGKITPDDRDIILCYINEKTAHSGLSEPRKKKIVTTLIGWQRLMRSKLEDGTEIYTPIRQITIFDITRGLAYLRSGNSLKGKPYAKNTIHDYISIGKSFWRWLYENEIVSLDPKKIAKIKTPPQNTNTTEAYELLTKDEILALINLSTFSRNQAIIALLYETGCRIGELASLEWRNVVVDEYGLKIYVTDFKEDSKRYVRCTMSTSYLSTWKNEYKKYGDLKPESLVFISIRQQRPLDYYGYIRIIEKAQKDAGITKKIHPHLFRKSRITHMVAEGYQESVIKRQMWNNLSTNMFDTYVKLSEEDIDKEMLDKAGIVRKEEKPDPLKPIICPRCHLQNAPTAQFCQSCGIQISGEVIQQAMEYDQEDVLSVMTYINNKKKGTEANRNI